MIRSISVFRYVALAAVLLAAESVMAEDLEPSDPFAAVDGIPISIGEINLVLTQRIDVKDLDRVGPEVRQATATLLVRRHLAMKALNRQGGDALAASVARRVDAYSAEAKRRGTSIGELARARRATEEAMVAEIAWTAAWSQYLKSKMTTANLRRYFESHRDRYAGGRFDVSQIFVKLPATDADSIAETTKRLTELVEEIRGSDSVGEAFAEAARDFSEASSAGDGGHVGWVEKDGDLPSQLMAAVRENAAGEVSDPVRSPLGMHVVMVHASEAGKLEFEDLADQSSLRRDAADALFEALVASAKDAKIVWFVDSLKVHEP